VAGFLPVIAALENSFGVDEDVGDVLDIADFLRTAADFE
jgi:hypothetical protein